MYLNISKSLDLDSRYSCILYGMLIVYNVLIGLAACCPIWK